MRVNERAVVSFPFFIWGLLSLLITVQRRKPLWLSSKDTREV
jgi:hypothetical protein